LNSNPTAPAKLYLDFNGDAAAAWRGYNVTATPAYDRDGDTSTFSDAEQANIQEIFARVAEKFSPFNVNVTTVDPGTYADKQAMKIVVGGDGRWFGPSWPGAGSLGQFYSSTDPNVAYCFSTNMLGYPKPTAEQISTLAGRAFGLGTQYAKINDFYVTNPGDSNSQKAPVMGSNSDYAGRGMWWQAYNPTFVAVQDDLAVISGTKSGFGFRPDDHGGSVTAATAITGTRAGIIEQTGDADYFSFSTSGGQVTINGAVANYGAMLDLKLQLLNASGQVVATADTATLGETLTANVAAGTYYVVASGHGWVAASNGNAADDLGRAADVGQYTLSVSAPGGGGGTGGAPVAPSGLTATGNSGFIELRWNDNSTNETGFSVQRSVDNGATWTTVKNLGVDARTWSDSPTKTGTVQYRVLATGSGGTQSGNSNAGSFNVKPGDVNLDGIVSGDDYAALDYAMLTPGLTGWANGDINLDGRITGDDYATLDYWILVK
jgi:hypothetical protein